MPTYPVNPSDPASPTDQQGAKQGAEEFRALKALIASMIVANSASAGPRQAIQSAVLDANGYNTALTVGAGLRPGLTASAVDPLHLSIANGFTGGKAINSDESIVANVVDILGADLPANNISYLYRNYGADYGSTLIPPQYGYAFDRTKQQLLRFAGVDGAVVTTDDFGSAVSLVGNAQLDTAVLIDTLNTLLLDGTGDYAHSDGIITTVGDGSWTLEFKIRFNALPAGATHVIFEGMNAGNFGIVLGLNDTAGTKKLSVFLSANGTAYDIANGGGAPAGLGTSVVWAAGTTYHIALVFDALAGKYFIYKDGVLDYTAVNTARINGAFTKWRWGDGVAVGFANLNGALAGCRFTPACLYPNGTAFATPNISTFLVTSHKYTFFSIPKMQMFEVTVASAGGGINPTLTSVLRLFLGEADTSGAAVTVIRNYALKGDYQSLLGIIPAINSFAAVNHNIGVKPRNIDLIFVCLTTEQGYIPGDELHNAHGTNATYGSPHSIYATKNVVSFATNANTVLVACPKTGGGPVGFVTTNWNYKFIAKRGW